jgi:hypothetical protein
LCLFTKLFVVCDVRKVVLVVVVILVVVVAVVVIHVVWGKRNWCVSSVSLN